MAYQSFHFACPCCRTELIQVSEEEFFCPADQSNFPRLEKIWLFLPPERQAYFNSFIRDYETVRRMEGRASPQAEYYRALPFADLTGLRAADWDIRARSYRHLVKRILEPLETGTQNALKIIDAGAGNGWLSYRLAQRNHQVAAVDLLVNPEDGLGAHVHYDAGFTPIQAEFDRLPFLERQFDLLVYNASFHYAVNYDQVLAEGVRVLKTGGSLVIMDTPVYHDQSSGVRMVQERETQYRRQFGFPSNALPSRNFLTYAEIRRLADTFSLSCRLLTPEYGLRWRLRPLLARLSRRREPARFHLVLFTLPDFPQQ
jgi:SAM-dependent methyltransferase